ncbi:MAG: histidine kinase [Treponema sp.]|nr:histidine kinase [Treponema sp.]
MEQWAKIERRLAERENRDRLLADVDMFRQSVQSYLNSEAYRIYRLTPFSPEKQIIGPSAPNEMQELHAAADLSFAFDEAVSSGDWEKALLVSADISDNLIQALIKDGEAKEFTETAFFRLFLVFIVFIVTATIVIWSLHKTYTRTSKREKETSAFTRAVLLAQEEERSRIRRELHDTIAQDLRGLSLYMKRIKICEDSAKREQLCTEADAAHSGLIAKVRDICDNLVPPDFKFQNLPDALRGLCFDFGKRSGIECRIDITENINLNFLNEEEKLQVFRIVQEALANAEKHAETAEAIVILHTDGQGGLAIGVSDSGKGFNPSTVSDREGHFGIRGMKERASFLGGTLEITSDPGEGTFVRLHIPKRGPKNDSVIN